MSSSSGALPAHILNPHRRAKQLIKEISDWISQQASQKVKDGQASKRNKGKKQKGNRKGAKSKVSDSSSGTISPTLYLPYTRDIVSNRRKEVPSWLLESLTQCIELRNKCVEWFEDATDEDNIESNQRHRYFVRILEVVLKKLARIGANTTEAARKPRTRSDAVSAHEQALYSSGTAKRTASKALEAEVDVEEDDDDLGEAEMEASDPFDDSHDAGASDIVAREATRTKYRRELARLAFLLEINAIWKHLIERWEMVRDGELERVVAAASTHCAIAWVKKLEADFNNAKYSPENETEQVYFQRLAGKVDPVQQRPESLNNMSTEFPLRSAYGLCRSLINKRRPHCAPRAKSIVDPNLAGHVKAVFGGFRQFLQ